MASEISSNFPLRLRNVEGLPEKRNDVIYCSPKNQETRQIVVFFGGDIQNYKEEMLAHRDNKRYADWDLESTACLLQDHFATAEIMVVRPTKMSLNTFCCYENFVEVNNFGAPNYQVSVSSIKHLLLLMKNASKNVQEIVIKPDGTLKNSEIINKYLTLIGFSKGCVVLNQLLYSFSALADNSDDELNNFIKTIKTMYWLEGGHSGISETWVTNKAVLEEFKKLEIQVEIHVTPYQVLCDSRPRIGKEEKIFRGTLKNLGVNVNRKLHFEDEPGSLENHFLVLKKF